MPKSPEKKKRAGGRRKRFATATVPRSLHLPPAFWGVLDELPGSRTQSFVQALWSERLLAALRSTLNGDGKKARQRGRAGPSSGH